MKKMTRLGLRGLEGKKGWLISAVLFMGVNVAFFVAWRSGVSEAERVDRLMAAAKTEVKGLEDSAASTHGMEAALREAEKRLAGLEAKLRDANERLPSDRHISDLLSDLSESGENVRIVAIKPLPPEDKGELARLPYQISVEAPFRPLGAYIEKIENLPGLIVIDNISIEAKEEGSRVLHANIFLSAFVLGYGGGS